MLAHLIQMHPTCISDNEVLKTGMVYISSNTVKICLSGKINHKHMADVLKFQTLYYIEAPEMRGSLHIFLISPHSKTLLM